MQATERNFNTSGVAAPARASVSELLGEVAEHSIALVKNELELVKAELREKALDCRKGVIQLVIGAIAACLSALALSAALINALAQVVGFTAAAFIYGGILLFISSLFIWGGLKEIKQSQPPLDKSFT